jgi:hypothetical protein
MAWSPKRCIVLSFILALFASPSYHWRPEIDLSNSVVFSTLFADGAH